MMRTAHDRPRRFTDAPVLPDWLLQYRGLVIWLFHMGLAVASSYIAFSIRFDGIVPAYYASLFKDSLPALLVARGTLFVAFRLYEGLWRYTSVRDLLKILLSVGLSSLGFLLFIEAGIGLTHYPRSILLIDALLLVGFTGGVRFIARAHRDMVAGKGGRRVLIYGAGDAGEAVAREMRLRLSSDYNPVGFVDDDRTKAGQRIHGIPVLGTRDDLTSIIKRQRPHEVIVTIPRAEASTYRGVVRALEQFDLPIKTLPHLRDILDGRVSTSLIRDLSLEDLLRREPIGLSQEPLLGLVKGKTILVTGAGGSIGAELCRQIASLKPATLVLYERHEHSLYSILQDLTARGVSADRLQAVIGDVNDRNRFKAVLQATQPEIVFHAAAHKHVPLMEENICEAVKNNVGGTQVAVELAEEYGVKQFVLISTDKAVNPVSVMGATKRVAELILQSRAAGTGTRFVTVRFGNVLGSNGSVVPLFVEQLKHGGPITVTHPDVRRYFMLIPEAVQLVLHAAAIGEPNSIYVLDMGQPVRLADVARDLIRLSGFKPDEVPIKYIGLRPGEKLDEELVGRNEVAGPSRVRNVMQVRPQSAPELDRLWSQLWELEKSARLGDSAAVLSQLRAIVPEFQSTPEMEPFTDVLPVATPHPDHLVPAVTPLPAALMAHLCGNCSSSHLYRSQISGAWEHIRRQFSEKRPYRCSDCGWRAWIHVFISPSPRTDAAVQRPDLRGLDLGLPSVLHTPSSSLIAMQISGLDPSLLHNHANR